MKSDIINIVCGADDSFSMPLASSIKSVLLNLDPKKKIRLFILDGGIYEHNKQRLLNSWDRERITVEWVKPEISSLFGLKVFGHIRLAAYFRILIPLLLPDDISRCIYLDSDLLALKDISQLWEKDFNGNLLMAVQDASAPYISSKAVLENFDSCAPYMIAPVPIPNYQLYGISPKAKYFNSGFMVMDISKWRDENITGGIIQYLRENENNLVFWDQDGLNAVLNNRWLELDHRWNVTAGNYDYPTSIESPFSEGIYNRIISDPWTIHFTTPSKPWHSDCDHPFVDLFYKYLDQTDWAGWRPAIPSSKKFFELYTKELISGTKTKKTHISVIMINWNGAKYISQAIESVLTQSVDDFEFIIVDICSEDESKEIIEKHSRRYPGRLRAIYLDIQNPTSAFNKGFEISTGNIICFLDINDVWFPNKLEKVDSMLSSHEDVSFYQHNLFMMDDEGIRWKKYLDMIGAGDFLAHTKKSKTLTEFSPLSGLSFNRSALDKVFPIPEQITHFIGEYLTHTSISFGDVLATTECFGAYRTKDRINWQEIQEVDPEKYFPKILIPILNQFYKDNNINLRFSTTKTQKTGLSLIKNLVRLYHLMIPLKLRHYFQEKIPKYREIARSFDIRGEE